MHRIIVCAAFALFFTTAFCQKSESNRPRLIVGLVVDQMRNDFLWRYDAAYSDSGFKRLLAEGFSAQNHHYSYAPTYTGPGHASIYTGTTPSVHGIIANDWYDPLLGEINCTQDSSAACFGLPEMPGASPHRLMATTITDELRLSTNYRAKVIGISLKDRGAILPAGHLANAAYWFTHGGNFISSTFYMDSLPDWVQKYNDSQRAEAYMKVWKPLLPAEDYTQSYPKDDNPYEGLFEGEPSSAFPHDLPALRNENNQFEVLNYSPYGNDLLLDFAREAIKQEGLGKDEITDFLTISFSATDYVGHRYGIRSLETEDTYARLDRQIAAFITYLDKEFGRDQYLLFLTSDHGAADNSQYAVDHKLPGGYISYKNLYGNLLQFISEKYGSEVTLVDYFSNYQVFLNQAGIKKAGLDKDVVADEIAAYLASLPGIYNAYTARDIQSGKSNTWPQQQLNRGYYPGRSGDILLVLNSGWHGHKKGTTHGSTFSYDTHVPLIFFGWNIQNGTTYRATEVRDLAVTLSLMLNISQPSGSTGEAILEVLE